MVLRSPRSTEVRRSLPSKGDVYLLVTEVDRTGKSERLGMCVVGRGVSVERSGSVGYG